TLGMGDEEMKEIASIIALVLRNAKPVILTKGETAGKVSKNKAKVPQDVMDEAKSRVQALLDKYLLYPELDMEVLSAEFPLA
ncbi:MAG: glycine hydroxymethyltransferase, partial [Spirochaetales bacterium]|nr:glycine hydroxymethyltransferase [Spirochaetales bacterium]